MKEDFFHNANVFDDFLKENYKTHTTEPDDELWDGIKLRLLQKKLDINIRLVHRLRIVSVGLVLSLLLLFIYYEIRLPGNQVEPLALAKEEGQMLKKSDPNVSSELKSIESSKVGQFVTSDTANTTVNSGISGMENSNASFPLPTVKNGYLKNNEKSNDYLGSIEVENKNIELLKLNTLLDSGYNTKLFNEKIPFVYNSRYSKSIGTSNDEYEQSKIIELNNKKQRFFIEGFFSPELSYRTLATNPEYNQTPYTKAYFNSRDKADFTYSAGIYIGYSTSPKINLISGLYFSQYAQKFTTESVNILKNNAQGFFVYTSSGIANLSLTTTDSIPPDALLKSSIRYNYLNLPFIVEYKILPFQSISAGLNFNYLLWQELNWEAQDANRNSEPQYDEVSGVKTASLGLILGTTFEKPIGTNVKLIINPMLKMHLMALSNSSPVKAYPYSLGLRVGIRYTL